MEAGDTEADTVEVIAEVMAATEVTIALEGTMGIRDIMDMVATITGIMEADGADMADTAGTDTVGTVVMVVMDWATAVTDMAGTAVMDWATAGTDTAWVTGITTETMADMETATIPGMERDTVTRTAPIRVMAPRLSCILRVHMHNPSRR